jgi:hypothetical protein
MSKGKYLYALILLIVLLLPLKGQQNRTLYNLHEVPQSSLLNPAVPLPCGWTIGVPILASIHLNYGNNFSTFNQAFTNVGNNNYVTNLYEMEKNLHRRNFINSELHVQLLELGYRRGYWSYMFTIIDKNNINGTIPQDLFTLVLHGNSAFEGQEISTKGTGVYQTYYREFAFSIAKDNSDESGISWGIRGKLLFGKLNVSTLQPSLALTTDGTTFNLAFDGEMRARTSLPVYYTIENNRPKDQVVDESQDAMSILMNRKNPGLGFDAGIIVPLSDELRFSASLVDIGFIMWRSNLHNYRAFGNFRYQGVLNDNINTVNYLDELKQALQDSLKMTTDTKGYNTWLAPKLLTGIHYTPSGPFAFSATADVEKLRTKWVTGVNASASVETLDNMKLIVSLAHQYNTAGQVGAGVVLGKHPLQFYAISDNVLGMMWPKSARNINLRFGFNIMPGCSEKESSGTGTKKGHKGAGRLAGTCGWEKEGHPHRKGLKRR